MPKRSVTMCRLIAVLLIAVVIGTASAQAECQELTFRSQLDALEMDPANLRTTLDDALAREVYSGLVQYAGNSFAEVEPDLATDWTISDDGLTYTFNLRQGAQFHHGFGEVTASDVKFSFDRLKDPAVASLHAADAAIIDNIEVVDDYTVRITLTQPFPAFLTEFLAYRTGYIVSQAAVEQLGDRFVTNPVGSGPFVWTEWVQNSYIVLTANEEYWDDTGRLCTVRVVIIPEDSLFEIALETGEVDIGYVTNAEVQQSLADNPDLKVVTAAAPQTMFLQINGEHEPFDDVRVRQALWYAIDKDALVQFVLNGLGEPSDTLFNPYVFGFLDETAYEYDPARARELLTEAGYPDGFSSTIMVRPHQNEAQQGTALQALWSQVGIDVQIVGPLENAQAFERYRNGDFDIGTLAFMRVGPDQIVRPLLHSASIPFLNSSRYSNATMDELIDSAQSEMDPTERARLYAEIQRLVHDEVPLIPLYQPLLVLAMSPDVEGATIPGTQSLNFTKIYKAE